MAKKPYLSIERTILRWDYLATAAKGYTGLLALNYDIIEKITVLRIAKQHRDLSLICKDGK